MDRLELKLKGRIGSATAELEAKAAELERELKRTILETILKYFKDSVQMKSALEENIKNKLEKAGVSDQISSESFKDTIEKLLKVIIVEDATKPKAAIT